MSNVKVFVLMAGLTALFVAVGGAVGGAQGAVMAFLMAAASNFFMYFNSASMVLRAYRAQTVTPAQAPELHAIVDGLRQRAGLPMPTLAVAPHQQPNAFATGRNPSNAVVCVTQGLVDLVDRDEIAGVLGHELGHVKNRDMLLQTFTASMAGAVGFLSRFAMFGGTRDERGSPSVNPLMVMLALASALRKLDAAAKRIPMQIPPAVAPLAQVNPLAAYGSGMARMFSTHPSTEERVARLEALAPEAGR